MQISGDVEEFKLKCVAEEKDTFIKGVPMWQGGSARKRCHQSHACCY